MHAMFHVPDHCHPPPPCQHMTRLCDESGRGGALVSPGGRQGADGLVVAGQTVDAGLDENEAELAVLVLAVALEMFADGHGLKTEDQYGLVMRESRRSTRTFLMSM